MAALEAVKVGGFTPSEAKGQAGLWPQLLGKAGQRASLQTAAEWAAFGAALNAAHTRLWREWVAAKAVAREREDRRLAAQPRALSPEEKAAKAQAEAVRAAAKKRGPLNKAAKAAANREAASGSKGGGGKKGR